MSEIAKKKRKLPLQISPTKVAQRLGITTQELWKWVRTGDVDGLGYTTQRIDYAQRNGPFATRPPRD